MNMSKTIMVLFKEKYSFHSISTHFKNLKIFLLVFRNASSNAFKITPIYNFVPHFILSKYNTKMHLCKFFLVGSEDASS